MVDKSKFIVDDIIKEINDYKFNKENPSSSDFRNEFVLVYKDESEFWSGLFMKTFLFNDEYLVLEDDLLFFIKKNCIKYLQNYDTKIETYRRTSKILPIKDLNIDWEETFFLNVIMQKFVYTLVYCICSRTASNQIQIIRKNYQKIYPSPSNHEMFTKGEKEKITYPDIYFLVDNFENKLGKLPLHSDECICIEIIANENSSDVQKSIYFGFIEYDSIKKIFTTKNKKRLNSSNTSNFECIKISGPHSKEHGEIAVIENFVKDYEKIENLFLEDMEFDKVVYKRRMSDPSSSLTSYIHRWREKHIKKSKSESQNVDHLGTDFIQAKDLNEELRNENQIELWNNPGYLQTYFIKKEKNKNISSFYSSYLTYLSIPWYEISNNLLAPAKKPILFF